MSRRPGARRRASARPTRTERNELARRVLIFGAFGLAVVVAVVTLSVLLFEFFASVLAGDLSADLVENERWSLALLLTAGAVAAHYGLVLREERQAAPESAVAERLREVVVVAPTASELGERLDDRVSAKVTVWARADMAGEAGPESVVESVVDQLAAVTSSRALVAVDEDWTTRVIALQRTQHR